MLTLAGAMTKAGGRIVTDADADLDESAFATAVTVTGVGAGMTAGAV